MSTLIWIFISVFFLVLAGCLNPDSSGAAAPFPAPQAKQVPKVLEKHGHRRTDDYYWMNEREDPEVKAYLEEENRHTESVLAHTADLQETLFEEIKGRIKPNDESVPYKKDGYYYYTRFEEGKEYAVHCRKKDTLENPEEIMLDVNKLAEGHDFFAVRGVEVSHGLNLLAYAVDTQGRRIYTIFFKNLNTGETLEDTIPEVTGNLVWANDNQTVFYTKRDPVTLRAFQVFRHRLGTDPARDALIYEEKDETFSISLSKTKSKKYLMITSDHTLSTEVRFLEADRPDQAFRVFLPREKDHEYDLDHYGDAFYIRTNWEAKNFRLMKTPVTECDRENWQEVIGHKSDVLLRDMELFLDYLVLTERKDGLIRIRIIPWNGGDEHFLDFGEPAYAAYPGINPDFNTDNLRFIYSSLTTPRSTFDYNMKTREKVLLKQDEVLGGFDSANYRTERLHAVARDGTRVPISLVYRKEMKKAEGNPLLIYGYGSYGASMDAWFNGPVLSLLDRGFIYAIAHVRGGQELGRSWYEAGKLFNKKNTFFDFIDCAEFLVDEGYTKQEKLFAMGGSAGGLLIGAVMNLRPDLFEGMVAQVPFVDVVTTMLDDTIPLTTSEYDEWGDPNRKDYYDYMLSYSPYDNIETKNYPHLLVTTGFHDSQVQYWEPAKWVAKLRAFKTDQNNVLLNIEMEAGHGGVSGRFRRYQETAMVYAFLLDLAGDTGSTNK